MHAYAYSRKLNKGRPVKFKVSQNYIETKKQALFEDHITKQEAMNLITLAYHFGKLTKEEYDVACFLEHLCNKNQKHLGVKTLPTSSPNTWNINLQNSWHSINNTYQNEKAQTAWKRIKNFLSIQKPKICNEFFNIISKHYSYEELQTIKTGTFNITNILKEGLQCVAKMIELGYL